MKPNILITGVNGFIGANIARYFADKNNDINLIGTSRQKQELKNYCNKYIKANLGDSDFISKFDKIGKIEAIIHAAACLSHNNFDYELISSNCSGILQISELARIHDCNKIIFISSIPIIGKPQEIPITESHMIFPLTTYHATKAFGEYVLNLLAKDNTNAIILRISSPVGVGMPKNKIFSVFAKKALGNEEIVLSGNGTRIQNYIDVDDIVQAVDLSLKYNKTNIFNIASSISHSNIELAEICIKTFKSKSKIVFSGEIDPEEEYNWTISIKKAKKELGYFPKNSIEDSLNKWKNSYLIKMNTR